MNQIIEQQRTQHEVAEPEEVWSFDNERNAKVYRRQVLACIEKCRAELAAECSVTALTLAQESIHRDGRLFKLVRDSFAYEVYLQLAAASLKRATRAAEEERTGQLHFPGFEHIPAMIQTDDDRSVLTAQATLADLEAYVARYRNERAERLREEKARAKELIQLLRIMRTYAQEDRDITVEEALTMATTPAPRGGGRGASRDS